MAASARLTPFRGSGYGDNLLAPWLRSVRGVARPSGTDLAVELLESALLQTGEAVNDRLRRPPRGGAPDGRVIDSLFGLEFSWPRARRRGPFRSLRPVSRSSRKQRAAIHRERLAGDKGVADRESSIASGLMLGATSKTL